MDHLHHPNKKNETKRKKTNKYEIFGLDLIITWHASFPSSPPAQKLLAGKIKIFSVTAFTFLIHSASLTIGISASRTRNGIGPAKKRTKSINIYCIILFICLRPCSHILWRYIVFRLRDLHHALVDILNKHPPSIQLDHAVWAMRYRYLMFGYYGYDVCTWLLLVMFVHRDYRIFLLNHGHLLLRKLRRLIVQYCKIIKFSFVYCF